MHQISAGAPSRTPLGELTALSRPLSGIKGTYSKRRGKVQGEEGEGKGVEGTPSVSLNLS